MSDQTQAHLLRQSGISQSGMSALSQLVAGELPAGIAALSAADQTALVAVLTQARAAQRQEIIDAGESLLGLVPGFLRGAVKRAAGL